jgi:hypothetical protein
MLCVLLGFDFLVSGSLVGWGEIRLLGDDWRAVCLGFRLWCAENENGRPDESDRPLGDVGEF